MNRRDILKLGGSALVATAIAGCSSNTNPDGTAHVSMNEDFAFDPKTLTVSAGTTVRWVNESEVGHTVTAYEDEIPTEAPYFASGGFESERAARNDVSGGLLATDETYEHTFDVTGTYAYVCIPHESSGMTGTITVK
ncbi:plastocyanin/azurin family copper-binding protein [Haloferax prahovense]|uniref:plastocyanin/azurin family copper-binding protein n=1 Tax=Haloferax prahovense TaxID=381852 RepID=UPI0006784BDF|nr:plastocyanin/azurin family copper-binding protein [Haloferax prahovense]